MKNLCKNIGKKLIRFSIEKLGVSRHEAGFIFPVQDPGPIVDPRIVKPIRFKFQFEDFQNKFSESEAKRRIIWKMVENEDFAETINWTIGGAPHVTGRVYTGEIAILPKDWNEFQ